MSLGQIKSATQDGTSGVPVAVAVNEDVSGNGIQAVAPVGNKTTYAEASRTGLTAVDAPTGGNLLSVSGGFGGVSGANLFDLGNALATQVRATCSVASAVLTGYLIFYDGSNNPIGQSELITLTANATLRLGNAAGDFITQRYLVDNGAARKAEFFVASVTSGTWAVYCRPV